MKIKIDIALDIAICQANVEVSQLIEVNSLLIISEREPNNND